MEHERDELRERPQSRLSPAGGGEFLDELERLEEALEASRSAARAGSFMEIIQEAQERERAAGRPVDPNMTVGAALEILGR